MPFSLLRANAAFSPLAAAFSNVGLEVEVPIKYDPQDLNAIGRCFKSFWYFYLDKI